MNELGSVIQKYNYKLLSPKTLKLWFELNMDVEETKNTDHRLSWHLSGSSCMFILELQENQQTEYKWSCVCYFISCGPSPGTRPHTYIEMSLQTLCHLTSTQTYLAWILTRRLAVLTGGFHGYSQSVWQNGGTIPKI